MTAQNQQDKLLDIRNLKIWFPIVRGVFSRTVGYIRALDGLSLHIRRGETLGLVGESGCGKTTLGRAIVGLENPYAGDITLAGQSIANGLNRSQRRKVQMIFQDPYASLNPRLTVTDLLTEGLEEFKLLDAPAETVSQRLLAEVGMDASMIHRYAFEFSGGQRQRISIARAIAIRPELVICDEPVSALDVSIQAQVINLLTDIKKKHDLSYLFITHDLGVVRHIADRVAVMYLGRIVEEGPTDDIIDKPLHPYTQALISAVPVPGMDGNRRMVLKGEIPSAAHPPSGCPFHPRCPRAMDVCRGVYPERADVDSRRVYCHLYPEKITGEGAA